VIGLAAKPPFHAAPRIAEADFGSWLTSVAAAHRSPISREQTAAGLITLADKGLPRRLIIQQAKAR
jgi:hypothetical protein